MKNESGIIPTEFKVLVKPKKVERKTEGGIVLPDEVMTKEEHSTMEGILVAVSPIAFTDPDWLETPKVGDKVVYDKFAGSTILGKDGEKYRLINDRNIGAILR